MSDALPRTISRPIQFRKGAPAVRTVKAQGERHCRQSLTAMGGDGTIKPFSPPSSTT